MENNVTTPVVQFMPITNDKVVKTSPKIIQKNQNKEIILKASGLKPTILQNLPTNQKIMLKIPNNPDKTKSNLKVIPVTKPNDDKLENGKNNVETKTIKLNQEQLKNLFSGSINTGNISGVKKPVILSMEKFKSLMNNPNFHLNQKSIKVVKTNSNTSPTKFFVPKASSQVIKACVKTSNPTTSEDATNMELTSSSQDTINTSSHSTVSASNTINVDEETSKSNHNQQNTIENSSSIVQTPTKNQTFQIRLSNSEISSANSIKLNPQSTKIIKLNQNIQSSEEKNSPVIQTSKNQTLQIQLNNSTVSSPSAVKIDPKLSKTIKLISNPTISTSKTVAIDPQSLKNIKLTNNLQNGVEKSSPIAQTAANNQKTRVQVNNSPVTPSSAIKTVKLNQNVVEKTSPAVQTLPKNQKFFLPPNNRFRIIHQNGKQIALPIVNEAPNNVTAVKSTNNVSKSLSTETQSDKTQKIVAEDKNPFVFDSITLPIGARKIYTRRPKTPEHVYKKFNLPLPSKSTESSKTIEKPQKLETNSKVGDSTNIKVSQVVVNSKVPASTKSKAATSTNSKVNQVVANNVTDHANEKHDESIEKKKRMSRKRTNIDYDSGSSNGTPVNNKTASMLIQTLKSKFVPLVGHACTATIIEHLNLAYSRCRISHGQAVKELIQYIDNYERYRDRKLLETKKKNNVISERSTQTEIEYMQLNENPIESIPSIIQNNDTNKRTEQKTVGTSIVPDITDEFSMFRLQLFKDWNSALVPDVMGNMPIHNAVLENDFFAVKRLCLILKHLKNINIQNESYDMTALHLAISNKCDIEIIEHLLESGVNPEIEDINGNNCLHMISQHGNARIMNLVLTKYRSPNLDLNTCNYNGSTPLMLCTEHDNVEIAKLLLKHKADTEVQDLKSGRTVLFQAIEANNEPMVKLLIEKGADPKKRDYSGITPLEVISEIRITPGIRKIMYKILSQNIVNLQRKRQRIHLDNGDDDVMLTPITSEKIRRINDENDDDNT
ncbi:myb-like protein U [Chrysoperla carnea]|uniref:myb-like protein U n=1 Tax=Chrysoperla carnea TaxID=189513 RepID=UPI001D06EDB0|nr:myb-like protein U [Chrysoperla carnea]XP_044739503.1 myb-like protein U [Chrysoperla carnea]